MEQPFQKDLSHLSWDQVYARQALRAELVSAWMDALGLKAGDRVLEVGAGPGYVSFALAERVGPTGMVYALDRSADALVHLERLQTERCVRQIQRIVADAALLDPTSVQAGSALITMVLHHADDPAGILRNVAQCVPPGAPVVIGEFHPEGPCSSGPPREHRLAVEKIRRWCKEAGLTVAGYRRQTPEHYMLFAQRGTPCVGTARRPDLRSGAMSCCPCSKVYLVSESVYRLGLRLAIIYSPSKTSATARSHTWAAGVMHSSETVSEQNNPSP